MKHNIWGWGFFCFFLSISRIIVQVQIQYDHHYTYRYFSLKRLFRFFNILKSSATFFYNFALYQPHVMLIKQLVNCLFMLSVFIYVYCCASLCMSLFEQELTTFPKHLSSTQFLWNSCSLIINFSCSVL